MAEKRGNNISSDEDHIIVFKKARFDTASKSDTTNDETTSIFDFEQHVDTNHNETMIKHVTNGGRAPICKGLTGGDVQYCRSLL